jgi:hypothetical protein
MQQKDFETMSLHANGFFDIIFRITRSFHEQTTNPSAFITSLPTFQQSA